MNANQSIHRSPDRRPRSGPSRHRLGFSVVELMVVVAIIILLVSVLLAALSGVRTTAKKTQTESRIDELARAVDEFQIEFNRYPGAVPWDVLAANPLITGTENVLLSLMGGIVTQDDEGFSTASGVLVDFGGFEARIDISRMGEGPLVDGSRRSPFFAPKENVLLAVPGQANENPNLSIPDLVDAWDQPIAFVSAMRTRGPLVGSSGRPQFARSMMQQYLDSTLLGEVGANQNDFSILSSSVSDDATADANFAQILRNPGFGQPDEPLTGQARGRYLIMSAGEDNIFFSKTDGPGSTGAEVVDISEDPGFVPQYDDIVVAGGG